MRREERVTVQGPVKEQQPDGMSHRGGGEGGRRQPTKAPHDVGGQTVPVPPLPTERREAHEGHAPWTATSGPQRAAQVWDKSRAEARGSFQSRSGYRRWTANGRRLSNVGLRGLVLTNSARGFICRVGGIQPHCTSSTQTNIGHPLVLGFEGVEARVM